MPPDTSTRPAVNEKELWHGGHKDKERLGNYWVLGEVGRGSFATVSKAYRSVSTPTTPSLTNTIGSKAVTFLPYKSSQHNGAFG